MAKSLWEILKSFGVRNPPEETKAQPEAETFEDDTGKPPVGDVAFGSPELEATVETAPEAAGAIEATEAAGASATGAGIAGGVGLGVAQAGLEGLWELNRGSQTRGSAHEFLGGGAGGGGDQGSEAAGAMILNALNRIAGQRSRM